MIKCRMINKPLPNYNVAQVEWKTNRHCEVLAYSSSFIVEAYWNVSWKDWKDSSEIQKISRLDDRSSQEKLMCLAWCSNEVSGDMRASCTLIPKLMVVNGYNRHFHVTWISISKLSYNRWLSLQIVELNRRDRTI